MPDCRAYELVTPTYGGGGPAFGVERLDPPISTDGETLLSLQLTGFAETENLEQSGFQYGAVYEFSRTPAGWTTEALDPPATIYPRGEFALASADLKKTLWTVLTAQVPGEEIGFVSGEDNDYNILLREPAGAGKGRFSVVGPVAAPGHELPPEQASWGVVAASSDLKHVLLNVHAVAKQLWPGDTTQEGAHSLYEYEGTESGEPRLVGVKNNGRLAGTPHVNEGAELVSQCGTVLGSDESVSTYNAISANGQTVYFTANACGEAPKANELYARIRGEVTVDISEPTTGPGGDCEVCDESEPKNAVFEGASEDGSKVFFRSEQQLLPGATGDTLYEYDFDASTPHSRVTVVSPDVSAVARISDDGARVYFESTAMRAAGAEAGGYNLYVYDTTTGQTSLVATLLTKAEAEGLGSAEVEGLTGVTAADFQRPFSASPNGGRYLVFRSRRPLTGSEDTSTVPQLFEYDAETGLLSRASVGSKSAGGYECPTTKVIEAGYNCNGNTANEGEAPVMVLTLSFLSLDQPTHASSNLSVSETGSVAFMSRDKLTPAAIGGRENIYEYEGGNVYLISAGEEAVPFHYPDGSGLFGFDRSGESVFFASPTSLVPQDTDTQVSWFDARAGGGFAAQGSPQSCQPGACQGPLGSSPALSSTAGSESTSGGGNLAPPAVSVTHKPKPLSRAQKLARALKACKKKKRPKQRAVCERIAHKQFGPTKKSVGK